MKRTPFFVATALLLIVVMTSPSTAGGAVKLSGVQFSLGSLIATGTVTGLGGYTQGVTAELTASGTPVVTCTSPGGHQAPGQNPSSVSSLGAQPIGPRDITKKGKAPLNVTAETTPLTGTQGGCPNDSWTAEVTFVFWTGATISIYDIATRALLLGQDYTCTTTQDPPSVSCVPVP